MALQNHVEAEGRDATGDRTVTKKATAKTTAKKKNGKTNGKANGKAQVKAAAKANGNGNGHAAQVKAPEGSSTIAFMAYPEHLAAVAALAKRDGLTRSAATRMLVEKGKAAMRLRVAK